MHICIAIERYINEGDKKGGSDEVLEQTLKENLREETSYKSMEEMRKGCIYICIYTYKAIIIIFLTKDC